MSTSVTKDELIEKIQGTRRIWLTGIFFICLVFLSALSEASAQSAVTVCTGDSRTETISMPAAVSIPRDSVAGPGTMLTNWFSSPAVTDYFVCNFSGYINNLGSGMIFSMQGLAYAGLTITSSDNSPTRVWKTNVEGVGFIIGQRSFKNACGWGPWQGLNYGNNTGACNGRNPQSDGGQIKVALVKTGPVKSGTVQVGTFARGIVEAQDVSPGPYSIHSNSVISFTMTPIVITAQTCLVTTPTVQVPLTPAGGIRSSVFTGIGKTYGDTPFTVGVDCSGVKATVAMTLTDQQNQSNTSSTLALTNVGNAAKGIGIQVLYNDNPVSYGPPSSVAGNTNQFKVFDADGDANAGVTNIRFVGRYIQTASKVTPGVANGVATFTMSYQ